MNNLTSSHSTLFQDRNLDTAVFPPRKPARFSTEPEGEGMEVCLRGFLVAVLVAAMVVCGVRLDHIASSHAKQPMMPDTHTAVVSAEPIPAPVAEAL